ncbi:Capsular polysaccharide synthesis protein [Streptococcus thermophilus]|uniref:capsular polysaccharide synthesis protein n=1 Tax=Streptococcus thermophilus TaxID=1308 RepID=UPI0015C1D59A|nr:capsular polysaccharide synthesis protein [Streptococcus thermophilus]MCE2282227.1 capsular biosynthesis protein [Streptococcus thermophilus]MCE2285267.1 capsular biosynthesis protein [Streptococcus thermophilus]CAD0147620.1 Capsular polysaccharide synthesis protein [Streptococcus thermophilus]CAD0150112.1 Capsular polysaccharide synthesis protein [Streptococcus thermophilus]
MINSFKKILNIFKKVNGFKVIKQYAKSRVLIFAVFQILSQGTSKKSLEIVRNSVDNKIINRLRKNYKREAIRIKTSIDAKKCSYRKDNVIWVCWFQGIENAPDIVKICIESLKRNIKSKDIIVITYENYRDYVTFPIFIQEKIDNGIISGAHMSDLLRLELLTKYGGTWVDATVYFSDDNFPNFFFDSDLFLFQKLKPALDGNPLAISNWFITSKANHPLLCMTKELLYSYWLKNNEVIHYFIFHMFFQIATEHYPNEWGRVIPTSSSAPHSLLLRLFDDYNEYLWDGISKQSSIHKLTYKFTTVDTQRLGTFYRKIIRK